MTNLHKSIQVLHRGLAFLAPKSAPFRNARVITWISGVGYLPVDGNSVFLSAVTSSSLLFPGRSRAGLWHPWLFSWSLPLCFGCQQKLGKLDTPETQSQPLEPSLVCLVPELSPPDPSWGQPLKVRGEFGTFAKSTRSKGVGQHQTWLTGPTWVFWKEIHTDKGGKGSRDREK